MAGLLDESKSVSSPALTEKAKPAEIVSPSAADQQSSLDARISDMLAGNRFIHG